MGALYPSELCDYDHPDWVCAHLSEELWVTWFLILPILAIRSASSRQNRRLLVPPQLDACVDLCDVGGAETEKIQPVG